jgi:hypothetical protein
VSIKSFNSPRLASPRLASPRLASPRLAKKCAIYFKVSILPVVTAKQSAMLVYSRELVLKDIQINFSSDIIDAQSNVAQLLTMLRGEFHDQGNNVKNYYC